ncbi:LAQU0S14e01090g1_1 [Lachancea quebecensis]|uniref:Pre-mRNA-splicing factor n=1 Tax=Lachancea quebecensis TaxID=1654605 RepID=A0A0P1KVW0_9SACH|nr:LAQU0S14e01090g1_1 [Lachancea quebecensis]
MVGFSINLKGGKVGKKGVSSEKKKRRSNVFNDADANKVTKSKIRITHIDEHQNSPEPQLIIKPPPASKGWATPAVNEKGHDEEGLGYGLNQSRPGEPGLEKQQSREAAPLIRRPNPAGHLPIEPAQEEYEAIPVEEFGDALLRGMGWDGELETEEAAKSTGKSKPVLPHEQFRPSLLGLGAKASKNLDAKGANKPEPFLPIVKVSRQTGKRLEER